MVSVVCIQNVLYCRTITNVYASFKFSKMLIINVTGPVKTGIVA